MKKNVLFLTLVAIFICNTAFAQILTKNPNVHKNAITSLAKVKATNYYKLGLCANEFNTEECIENVAKALGYDNLKELPITTP